MTEGICLTCGGLTSSPMYRCACGIPPSVTAGGNEPVVFEDGVCQPATVKPMISQRPFTSAELVRLRELLKEGAP